MALVFIDKQPTPSSSFKCTQVDRVTFSQDVHETFHSLGLCLETRRVLREMSSS